MASNIVVWTGVNFDEISALGRGGPCAVTLTAYRGELRVKNEWDTESQRALPGDVISRSALGELHVFPAGGAARPSRNGDT